MCWFKIVKALIFFFNLPLQCFVISQSLLKVKIFQKGRPSTPLIYLHFGLFLLIWSLWNFLFQILNFFRWKQIKINDLDIYFSNKGYFSLFWQFLKDVFNKKVNLRYFPDHFEKKILIQNTETYLLIKHKKNQPNTVSSEKNFINQLIFQKSGQVKRVSNFF